MGVYTQRLGASISFDEEKEADIIKAVQDLTDKHKLGPLISNLLRVYFENPSKFGDGLKELERFGISYNRQVYFNNIAKELDEMRRKVNEIYDMNLKLLTLAKFGKHIGLEGKVNNSLMAQFILEKQLKDLSNKLGVDLGAFNSNKIQEVNKLADDTLEYIIETYDSIVTELRDIIFREIELKFKLSDGVVINADRSIDTNISKVEDKKESLEVVNEGNEGSVDKGEFNTFTEDDDDEYIDFGNADLNALSTFLGG